MEKNKVNEAELDSIMAEVKTNNFIEQTEEKVINHNRETNNFEETNEEYKEHIKIDKKIRNSLVKNVALMVATGVCGYFKLISPILYIPIELVCLCTVCFKCGEYKGKTEAKNALETI